MSKPKKTYDLPGQTADPPPKVDSLRLFYTSLFTQKGVRSPMAMKWLLKHGLLPEPLARKLDSGIWDPKKLIDVIPKFNFKPAKVVTKSKDQTVVQVVRFNFKPAKKLIVEQKKPINLKQLKKPVTTKV